MRNHLARFPGGTTERYARTELEQLVWAGLGPSPEQAELEAYVSEFPTGKHTAEASSRIGFLKGKADAAREAEELKRQETEAWAKASGEDTKEAYEAFLREWPQSGNVRTARTRMRQLSGGEQKGAGVTRGLFLGLCLFVVLIYATLYATQQGPQPRAERDNSEGGAPRVVQEAQDAYRREMAGTNLADAPWSPSRVDATRRNMVWLDPKGKAIGEINGMTLEEKTFTGKESCLRACRKHTKCIGISYPDDASCLSGDICYLWAAN